MSDIELILGEIKAAESEGREISDACARVIASQFHDGSTAALSLVSTGAIVLNDLGDAAAYRACFPDYESLEPADKPIAN